MIRRYLPTETVFNHNKYVLSPIKAEVIEVANGMFESEIEIMMHVALNKGDIISAPTPRGEQPFRVYRITKTLNGKKAFARHIFYDLVNALLLDTRPTNTNVNGALQSIFNTVGWPGWSYLSDITDLRTAYYIRKNPVEAIIGAENSILNTWGGNLVRNGKEVRILANGIDRGYEIRLGKNLLGIEDDSDDTNVRTRLYPTYEKDQVIYALPEKYVDSPLIGGYPTPIEKEVRVALTDDQKAFTDEQIYQVLRDHCNNLFSVDNVDKPIVNYKVDFVELSKISNASTMGQFTDLLEKIDLYDEVRINVDELDINLKARVIKYSYDAIAEKYLKIELGGFKSSNQYQVNNLVQQLKNDRDKASDEFRELYDLAINKVTGNKGGYQITRRNANNEPYETLWMDTPDISTAQKVLRINKEGIAGSATGFNGPYGVAITTDGWIVAERIQAISLSAISANLGTVTAGRLQDADNESYWDMDNKEIVLNVKSLKITSLDVATKEDVEISVGDKSTNEDLNALANIVGDMAGDILGKADAGELETLADAYNQRLQQDIADKAKLATDLSTLDGRIAAVDLILGDKAVKWSFIETSITATEEGVFIGNSAKQMGVLVAEDRISFIDKGTEVAYISNKTMEITHGIFVESAVIGKHKIETIAGTDITVFVYVG